MENELDVDITLRDRANAAENEAVSVWVIVTFCQIEFVFKAVSVRTHECNLSSVYVVRKRLLQTVDDETISVHYDDQPDMIAARKLLHRFRLQYALPFHNPFHPQISQFVPPRYPIESMFCF
jgi:hypothetical protein